MAYSVEVKYFNSFVLRKLVNRYDREDPFQPNQRGSWPSLPWAPTFIGEDGIARSYPNFPWGVYGTGSEQNTNWYLEESRIKGGFNNSIMELGVRAYAVNTSTNQSDRSNGLIFSGVYNDRTSFNNTNVFSISENIIKDADPLYGSIQKIYSENTNLVIFQENKIHKALINKNTIYSGNQGAKETSGEAQVIGQLIPYSGEYGISRNPESFAFYGNRKYFTDKDRGAVLRLSAGPDGGDGVTEISMYGMRSYFRDQMTTLTDIRKRRVITVDSSMGSGSATTLTLSNIVGIEIGAQVEEFDGYNVFATGSVVVDIPSSTTVTISPDYIVTANLVNFNFVTHRRDKIYGGWDIHNKNYTLSMQNSPRFISTDEDSFNTLSFDENASGWTSFYTYKPIFLGSLKNKFYTFINNEIYQQYVSIGNNYCKFYGNATPDEASVELIFNPSPSIKKNFNTMSYEGDNGWEVESIISSKQGVDNGVIYQDAASPIKSYDEGSYVENGVTYQAGFDRKENRYVANIVNASSVRPGEIIFGKSISGIKGYFATVKIKVDSTTNVGGAKELYLASSNYVMSSY